MARKKFLDIRLSCVWMKRLIVHQKKRFEKSLMYIIDKFHPPLKGKEKVRITINNLYNILKRPNQYIERSH